MRDDTPEQLSSCNIDIVALAGGDESVTFVDMLLSMYSLWAYNHHFRFTRVEPRESRNGSAMGRAKLRIVGADAAMLAERENGIHRMIRIPPGKTQRHMSFAAVQVSGSADAALPPGRDGWGNEIRSLVVEPEAYVKNHRSGYVCHDIVGVLAGDLEKFWEERT